MNVSDYALIISILSILVAIGSFLWNVWQKFIFVRPSLNVSFGLYRVFQKGIPADKAQRLLNLTVTNMGPGPVILASCIAEPARPWWKRPESYGMLNPIHGDPTDPDPIGIGPFGGGLPVKIDAGEMKSFYFPYTADGFLKEELMRIGINDTYHRNTWCPRKDIRKVNASYKRDFPDR